MLTVLTYLTQLLLAVLSATSLIKDWKELKKHRLHQVVFFVTIFLAIVGALTTFFANRQAAKDKVEATANQVRLEGEITGGRDTAVDAIKGVSREVAELKTQIKTEALQKQLARTEAELQATERAMAPGPKASLIFTFSPFVNPPIGQEFHPVTDIKLPRQLDRTFHVEFAVMNNTTVSADDIDMTVLICDSCKYSKEPEGMIKQDNLAETQRVFHIQRLLPKTVTATIKLDVLVPPGFNAFTVGFLYRCKTCDLPKESISGTIRISG